jgi:hypothetical protein
MPIKHNNTSSNQTVERQQRATPVCLGDPTVSEKLLFIDMVKIFKLKNDGKLLFLARLTTYSPATGADEVVPEGVRIASCAAVRDPRVVGSVVKRAPAKADADAIRAGPSGGIGIAVAGQYTISMRTHERTTRRVGNRNRTLIQVAAEFHDAPVGRPGSHTTTVGAIRRKYPHPNRTLIVCISVNRIACRGAVVRRNAFV